MSDEMLRLLIGGVLLCTASRTSARSARSCGSAPATRPAPGAGPRPRSWLAPGLAQNTANQLAIAIYAVALVGFVLTALAFWGIVLPVDWWRPLGVVAALVSTAGIVLFLGTWPVFNTVAALAINIGVIVAVLIDWPPASVLGA